MDEPEPIPEFEKTDTYELSSTPMENSYYVEQISIAGKHVPLPRRVKVRPGEGIRIRVTGPFRERLQQLATGETLEIRGEFH